MEPLLFSLMSLWGENGFILFQRVTDAINAFALFVASPARTLGFNSQAIRGEDPNFGNQTRITVLL
jgi:hypothetical protein